MQGGCRKADCNGQAVDDMSSETEKKPILLVMAAGMGSRYGGLKQIDPVGSHGEIIMDFALYDAMMAGFERVIFVIKEEMEEDFKALIEGKAAKYFDVNIAFQKQDDIPEGYEIPEGRVKPWGTAQAVYSAREYIDAPFCVINSDDYYGPGAFQTIYEFLEKLPELKGDSEKELYGMVAYQLDKTLTENGHVARGVCSVSDDNKLLDVVERTKIMWRPVTELRPDYDGEDKDELKVPAFTEDDGETWEELAPKTPVSMNFWGFDPSIVRIIGEGFPAFLDDAIANNPMKGEYLLPTVVGSLVEQDKAEVEVLHSGDKWFGVTYKEDKEAVVDSLQSLKDKGVYPEKLWN